MFWQHSNNCLKYCLSSYGRKIVIPTNTSASSSIFSLDRFNFVQRENRLLVKFKFTVCVRTDVI